VQCPRTRCAGDPGDVIPTTNSIAAAVSSVCFADVGESIGVAEDLLALGEIIGVPDDCGWRTVAGDRDTVVFDPVDDFAEVVADLAKGLE
jgi:hypothetical protein